VASLWLVRAPKRTGFQPQPCLSQEKAEDLKSFDSRGRQRPKGVEGELLRSDQAQWGFKPTLVCRLPRRQIAHWRLKWSWIAKQRFQDKEKRSSRNAANGTFRGLLNCGRRFAYLGLTPLSLEVMPRAKGIQIIAFAQVRCFLTSIWLGRPGPPPVCCLHPSVWVHGPMRPRGPMGLLGHHSKIPHNWKLKTQ